MLNEIYSLGISTMVLAGTAGFIFGFCIEYSNRKSILDNYVHGVIMGTSVGVTAFIATPVFIFAAPFGIPYLIYKRHKK